MKFAVLSFCTLVAMVAGHGAMVNPRSRNSVDWIVDVNVARCSNNTGAPCQNGQASMWYSQGCFIGCPTCDTASGRRQTDLCGLGKKQTLVDPKYWSLNRDAVPFSDDDIYRHNPWRAPGSAPVSDACGLAGGSYSRKDGAEAGDYEQTQYAQHGDIGSVVLKALPASNYTPPVYKRGGTANVSWSIRNNHGGGYQYRLCKTPDNFSDISEKCFQQTPLDFVQDQQAILYPNGTQQLLSASQRTFVSGDMVSPAGSTWSMMPMPPTLLGPCCIPGVNETNTTLHHCISGESCRAAQSGPGAVQGPCSPCPQTAGSDCSRCDQVYEVLPGRYKNAPQFPVPFPGSYSGVDWGGYNVADVVKIPANIPPGDYILGFRYDCEATAQVWSNCADVVIE